METDIQKLLRRLEKAFRNAKFPGSHAQRVGYQGEISAFLGKTWQEVTVEDINKTYTLIYFSERGLLYYLPAYLRGIAQNYQKLRYIAFVQIITELGDPKLTQRSLIGRSKTCVPCFRRNKSPSSATSFAFTRRFCRS